MAHHAYVYAGEQEAGIAAARAYGARELGCAGEHNPDLIIFRHALFTVDDSRRVIRLASQAPVGEHKLIVIAVERFFHEAQNALLKVFEEPPVSTTLVLVVPSLGILIPTLRSRLIILERVRAQHSEEVYTFLAASPDDREKHIAKLLERTKSDKDEEKQRARGEALRLIEGIETVAYARLQSRPTPELSAFLADLERFLPILHERSAPLKLMFEHVALTMPRDLVP